MTGENLSEQTGVLPGAAPGVRHDLRHALSTLQTLLTVAEARGPAVPDQVRRLMATARREAGLALDLLEALPARDDVAGHPVLAAEVAPGPDEVCDLDGVLRAAADTVARTGRTVVVASSPPLLVPLSRTAMMRVVRNLLTNAVVATGDTGSVELRGIREEPAERADGRSVIRLEVHDDGPGLPAHGAHRPGGQGLSVVRSLVLPAGGWLVLGRSPRGGACACVSLPEACEEVRT